MYLGVSPNSDNLCCQFKRDLSLIYTGLVAKFDHVRDVLVALVTEIRPDGVIEPDPHVRERNKQEGLRMRRFVLTAPLLLKNRIS